MLSIKNKKVIVKSEKREARSGFTLIEMLVSIAIFSLVLVVILGAIMSIVDANRKARTLMTVMNNLNFTVESMTRSFKTGQNAYITPSGQCFVTQEVDYRNNTSGAVNTKKRYVEYCIEDGQITKNVEGNGATALTSPDVEITNGYFEIINQGAVQPLLIINLQGEVIISSRIRSAFNIQTSVSQRILQTETILN